MNQTIKLGQVNNTWYGVIKTVMFPFAYYAGPVIKQGTVWCPAQTASHLWHETCEEACVAFLNFVDPPAGLRRQMQELVGFVQAQARRVTEHHELCCLTAMKFNLFENDRFPIWLSRVVEGVQRDVAEGIKDV